MIRIIQVFILLLFLPLASIAKESSKPAALIEVTKHVYTFVDGDYSNLVLITSKGIVVVDPMSTDSATKLVTKLKHIAPDKKLLAIVYSHYHADHADHADHAGGARPLLDAYGDISIIANKKTAELLADRNWKTVVAPDELIDPPFSRNFGELTLVMIC